MSDITRHVSGRVKTWALRLGQCMTWSCALLTQRCRDQGGDSDLPPVPGPPRCFFWPRAAWLCHPNTRLTSSEGFLNRHTGANFMTLANKNNSFNRIGFQRCLITTADPEGAKSWPCREGVGLSRARQNAKQSQPRQHLRPGQEQGLGLGNGAPAG